MKQIQLTVSFLVVLFLSTSNCFAWGNKGHALVAEVAFNYLDANTKNIVLNYLDGMTIEEAANWMDNLRDDHSYDYMKPYHYANFEKGSKVTNDKGSNIIAQLYNTIHKLKDYKKLSKEEVKIKLCIIFHLVGDLHQPLHVGYGTDKGGNTMQFNFNGKGTNLHSFFDSGIIKYKDITLQDCLDAHQSTKNDIPKYHKRNVLKWANQSRSYLDEIYNFDGHQVSQEYVDKNAIVIKNQLLDAGINLASVLKKVFKS